MDDNNSSDRLEQIARSCIAICEEKKAADIVLFDVRENSILADYYLVCCGNSMPHVRAIAESLRRTLLSEGFKPRGLDGAPASQWVVLDFSNILIHVMTPDMRRHYCLEELWDKRLIVFQGGEPLPENTQVVDDEWGSDDEWEDDEEDDEDGEFDDDEDFDDDGEFDDEEDGEFDDEFDDEEFDDEEEEYEEDDEDEGKPKPKKDGGISLKDIFGDDN